MTSKLMTALGFTVLLLSLPVQNAISSLTVTTADDSVQFTGETPITYTGTGPGSYTISGTSGTTPDNASGSLQVTRGIGSLDYIWSATSVMPSPVEGVGIEVKDDFTLSGTENFQLTFAGSYYTYGYLENVTTGAVIEKFGFVPPTVDVGPSPPLTVSGVLASGNYELSFSTGALPLPPSGDSESGEVSIVTTDAVPIPAAVWLFGSGLLGLIGLKRKRLPGK
jgi:hypothetical protein